MKLFAALVALLALPAVLAAAVPALEEIVVIYSYSEAGVAHTPAAVSDADAAAAPEPEALLLQTEAPPPPRMTTTRKWTAARLPWPIPNPFPKPIPRPGKNCMKGCLTLAPLAKKCPSKFVRPQPSHLGKGKKKGKPAREREREGSLLTMFLPYASFHRLQQPVEHHEPVSPNSFFPCASSPPYIVLSASSKRRVLRLMLAISRLGLSPLLQSLKMRARKGLWPLQHPRRRMEYAVYAQLRADMRLSTH